MTNLLKVDNLSIGLANGVRLLDGIGFEIKERESFALLGESGSGKSLTALSILRLLPDNIHFKNGNIQFGQQDILKLPELAMRGIRGGKIAFIFQEPMTSMNPVMTAGEQIVEVLKIHKTQRMDNAKRKTLVLLENVGMQNPERVFSSYPHELSGGMKQRVMIAIALAGEPDLLIADEPTTALDVTIQAEILQLLKSLQDTIGMAMLFISHNLSIVSNVADRLAVMRDGQIVETTTAKDFFKHSSHQYSRHLIEVVPTLEKRGTLLQSGKEVATDENTLNAGVNPLLEVKDLKVHFPVRSGIFRRQTGAVKAVDGVSFSLHKGKTLAMVGESGSGKTTVAKAILGLADTCSGEIYYDNYLLNAKHSNNSHKQHAKVQIVWQDPFSSMNPKMLVGEIIKEGMYVQNRNLSEQQAMEEIVQLLHEVGLESDVMHRYPHEFSGGQRQRLCIVRALAVKPDLLICDEPTSALDVSVQAQILDLFQNLQRTKGLSYLFITHDIAVVAFMAHDIAVMYKGKIIEQGDAVSLLNRPQHKYTQSLLDAVPTLHAA